MNKGRKMLEPKDIDLNLLVVFQEVFQERQISSVAKKLGLSQPAVSNALARLRKSFADELFVRTAQGPLRYSNQRSAERYLTEAEATSLEQLQASSELLTQGELFEERVAMGLRLTQGIDLGAVCHAFGEDLAKRAMTIRHLRSQGMLTESDGRLMLTDRGFDVHSAIAARLM